MDQGAPNNAPSPVRPITGDHAGRRESGAVDAGTATRIASSLRRRPGHVVVTAPFVTTASRLFELAEPQLGSARIIRLSARLLAESEVARALAGVTARGLPPPSPAALAAVIEEARTARQTIILLVDDGDSVQLDRLDRVRELLGRTPAMREVVRLVLLGSGALLRMLDSPEAKPFVDTVALHLNIQAPDVLPGHRDAEAPTASRARAPREAPGRFVNEKLLVLAVGVVLVTGVLLFPIEPTRYPKRTVPVPVPVEAVADVEPAPEPIAEPPTSPEPSPVTVADEAGPASDRRFRPPVPERPALQVGAFRDRANAVRLAERLAPDFGDVYIDQLGEGDASLHRVRVVIPDLPLAAGRLERALTDRGFAPVPVEP